MRFRNIFALWRRVSLHFYNRLFNYLLWNGVSPRLLFGLQNLHSALGGSSVRFSLKNGDTGLGEIRDGRTIRFFSDPRRGLWLYRSGLRSRKESLFRTYCLEHVEFSWGDTVVDCGANYGDLWLGLEGKINPKHYVAIEPSLPDFRALSLNSPAGATLVNKALGAEQGVQDFFLATEGGDSSLIEPRDWDNRVQVDVVRLDDLIESLGLSRIKLFKLEAEGYEPEILLGADRTLGICEFVAIDGGYERGIKEEQTFSSVTNTLISRGFEMVDVYFSFGRALFRKHR